MQETITDMLIAFCTAEVPTEVNCMMRLSLFDWAACGIAGAQESEFAAFAASQVFMHPGLHCVFGQSATSAPTAALVNGTLSHALDYDDTHFAHIGHPSVAILPAVLALAEQTGAGLDELIDAAAIGAEASIIVGLWLGRDHYQVGYHQTATAGAFGATVGACRLLGLTPRQIRHALGLCSSMASGIKEQFGTMGKPLNAGLAARTGVEAALWAQSGMTAAHDGLAGKLGFMSTHYGQGADVERAEDAWRFLSISHKFHACCHGLHAMLEALRATEVTGADVQTLHIQTHPRWMSVCNNAHPKTGLAAKFSYAQTAAMMLLGHDTAAIASYTDDVTQDARVTELRNRINVSENAELTETQADITVTLTDGSSRQSHHDLMTPIAFETRVKKLRAKCEALLGEARMQLLWEATQGTHLDAFTDQLVRSRS